MPNRNLGFKNAPMATLFPDHFHAILEREFSRLGFAYYEILQNGIFRLDDSHYQLVPTIYQDCLPEQTDGMSVSFVIKSTEDGKPPHIELILASLLKQASSGELVRIVKSHYSSSENKLPTIEQLRNDLVNSLILLNSLGENVKTDFDRLGFDLTEIIGTANFEDDSSIRLYRKEVTDECPRHIRLNYSFAITQSQTNLKYSIREIQVEAIDPAEYFLILKKAYCASDQSLPGKKQILSEIMEDINAHLANIFFSVYTEIDNEFNRYGFEKETHKILFDHEVAIVNVLCDYFKITEKVYLPGETEPLRIDFIVGAFQRQTFYYKVESINAILYKDTEMLPLYSKKYNLSDGPLPSKNEIYGELQTLLRIKAIKQKFGMDGKQKENGLNPNNVKIKRGS